ncbi:YcaO-like family protein [Nocardiopsis rhodophaea]|uniref:YcaO-like family protein n=1 Tax=Nocardiopsis rhodophaea TaxID=280238 RepID=UPI0031D340DF
MRPESTRTVGGPAANVGPPTGAVRAGTEPWAGAREREFPLRDAEKQARREIAHLGWRPILHEFRAAGPSAAHCQLRGADSTPIPQGLGSGKGCAAPARVGALFEALEHAFTGPRILTTLPVELRDLADLAAGPLRAERAMGRLDGTGRPRLACLPYDALDGGGPIDVPLFLWAPWYPLPTGPMAAHRARLGDTADYRAVLSFSVNTGCAIGATRDEALLHALNEWAERDALSVFLLRTVHDGGPLPARLSPSALPPFLRQRLAQASAAVQGPVTLLDLTTDIDVPVVLAHAPPLPGGAPRYGVGASLSGENAVERAVSELVQDHLIAQWAREPQGADARARLAAHPRLLACAQMAVDGRIDDAPWGPLPADAVAPAATVAEQRAEAVRRISAAGHRVVARDLAVLAHGTAVVQVQCPGLERFHLITDGHLALPGPRGRRLRAQPPRSAHR